ncbi:hypothetical protein JKF63_04234 [Porcisia hertigi]|uniref:C2H2-type domain-containing protein n=1 Tax=Porcisia hertigi TaxID=2761500 RepID=A0A836L834_9TRYP|nr:hypothetical protein JKF63_04234 [Porcisia hertigi]
MPAPRVTPDGRASAPAVGFTVHLVCPDCGKAFTGNSSTSGVRSNYRRHLLTHTGERPFPCSYCHQRFTTKPNLRRHVRSLHPCQATPSTQVRHPNGAETAGDAMAASPPPLPEMHLPPSITASLTELASTGSTAAAAVVNPGPSCSSPSLPQPVDPVVFTCEDCELETSSRAKLRRHKRYYCPFRDNIFADPVTDALRLYSTHHHQQQQQRDHRQRYTSANNSGDSDEANSAEEGMCNDGEGVSFVSEGVRRRRRTMGPSLALTEAERNYLAHVAERSGLKFVEDAYASDGSLDDGPDSGMFSEASSLSTSSQSSSMTTRPLVPPHTRCPAKKSGALLSPKRTPLHGSLPSPYSSLDRRLLSSPQTAAGAASPVALSNTSRLLRHAVRAGCPLDSDSGTQRSTTGAQDAGDDEDDDVFEVFASEGLLRLHHHRRGSGHRRERHILQKRLRAQEGALMTLATDSPYRRSHKPRPDHAGVVGGRDDAAVGETKSACPQTAVSDNSADTSPPTPAASYAYLGPSQSLLTPHVVAQAESLLVANWRHPQRGKLNAANAFVCPYCADFTTFASQRGLRAHSMRVHADKMATARASVAEIQAAQAEGCRREEAAENGVLP